MRNGGTAIWQGFDFSWLRTPHRLNHLGSWLDELTTDDEGPCGRARCRLTVGRVPDRGVARTFITGLRSTDVRFVEGTVEADVGAAVGQAAVARAPRVEVPLHGADPQASTVVLRGFDMACTSHPAGVHPQGLGIRLLDVRADGGRLSFVPEFFLHANNSPDPLTTWRGGFSYRMRLMYTVVLAARGAAACTPPLGRPCVRIAHGREQPGLVPRVVQGLPGFSHGLVGLQGFRFDQLHRGRWRRDGRYLRRFHCFVGDASYDPRVGRLTWHPQAWFSNAGMVSYPLRAQHQLWTTFLQLREGHRTHPHVVEHEIDAGAEGEVLESPFILNGPEKALAG